MRKLMLTLATLFVLVVAPAANTQGFLFELISGPQMLLLFDNNTQYRGADASILYSANEETLKSVNPLEVRLAAYKECFFSSGGDNATHKSIGEMFAAATRQLDKKRTILQVARVFFPDSPRCITIWFAYIEK